MQWTTERQDEVAHLAVARSQNTGTGILGNIQKIRDSRFYGCLFSGIKGGKKGKKIAETE